MAIRIEKDSLGNVEVPAEALYGAQTARAIVNFPISGLRANPAIIRAIAAIKLAAAQANAELKLITDAQATAIEQAAREILDGQHHDAFPVDVFQAGAGVSFHMNANEVIANRAGQILGDPLGSYKRIHPNDHVNYGQSTNDVFPSAMRLSILLALEGLYPVLDSLEEAFSLKALEFDGILKSGRTHMQDATPIRLGQEFAAYGVAIAKSRDHIRGTSASLRELGLGGSAVGTGINTHPQYRVKAIANLAKLTGQELTPAPDMRYAMQSCVPMSEISGALRSLALEIIRISNDLRLLSSGPNTGFNEIGLPGLQPGSSIMPGKVNPVLPELVAMVGFQVMGNDTAVALAVQAGQLELNVMMPTMAHNVLQSITILTHALHELDHRCIRGITANTARCNFYAQSTVSLATALNPYIGYSKAAEIVKESVATGRSILDLAREKKLLTEEQIHEILDPLAMTEPRETI
jgi:aspartate ammonia-lyase